MGDRKKIIFFTALLAFAITSTGANSIVKRETNRDYFNNALNQLSEVKKIPLVGEMMGCIMSRIQAIIRNIDRLTEGNLSAVINSIMPCHIDRFGTLRCEGTFDMQSARKLIKKAFDQLPFSALPTSISSVIRTAADFI